MISGNPQQMAVILLAGGASSRMGQDKRSMLLRGKSLIRRSLDQLSPLSDQIVISTNDDLPEFHAYLRVPDLHPGTGPLDGLLSAFQHITLPYALVATCDMPFVGEAALKTLISQHSIGHITVFSSEGRVQPFPGLYPTNLLPDMKRLYREGVKSFQELIRALPSQIVKANLITPSLPIDTFLNLNNPSDFKHAEDILNTITNDFYPPS